MTENTTQCGIDAVMAAQAHSLAWLSEAVELTADWAQAALHLHAQTLRRALAAAADAMEEVAPQDGTAARAAAVGALSIRGVEIIMRGCAEAGDLLRRAQVEGFSLAMRLAANGHDLRKEA